MPDAPPTVRAVRPEDADAVATLHVAAIRARGPDAYDERQVEAWTHSPGDDGLPVDDPDRHFVVAERDGRVVGFGDLTVSEAEVTGCYVHPDHARSGVGTALLRDLEAAARERGLATLSLWSSLNAVGFYERHGYERVRDVDHETTAADGEQVPLPVVEMRKAL